ncbi:MAG: glycosyltransferase family 61 protein [Salinivirgaceae bacterium]|jgi:capsular polysaccharide biosynthesis protein
MLNIRAEKIIKLHDGIVSIRSYPKNIIKEDIWLFEHELKRTIPDTYLKIYSNTIVTSNGLVLKQSNLIEDNLVLKQSLHLKDKVKILLKNLFLIKRLPEKPYLITFNSEYSGYFHWITETLTRIMVTDNLHDFVLLMPDNLKIWQKETLSVFKPLSIEYLNTKHHYKIKSLNLVTHTAPSGNYNDSVIRQLRQKFIESFNLPINKNKRIYISRQKARFRKLLNEQEFVHAISDFGFETYYFEELSFQEQIRLSAQCEIMIGLHGAGLTNMLFMSEGTKVIELRIPDDKYNNCYYSLANALNLDYYYVLGKKNTLINDFHSTDILIEINKISLLLSNILK